MRMRARAGVVVVAVLAVGGCGLAGPSDGDVLGTGRCEDDPDDAFLVTDQLTEGRVPSSTEVSVEVLEIEAVEITYEHPGTIRAAVVVAGDIEAAAAEVEGEPTETAFHWSYEVGVAPDLSVRAEITVVDGAPVVDAFLRGTFRGEKDIGDEVVFADIDTDIRAGEGVPFAGALGFAPEYDREGPLTIAGDIDGDRFEIVVGHVDEYQDLPEDSFQTSTAFSPDDRVQDDCGEGIIRFDD